MALAKSLLPAFLTITRPTLRSRRRSQKGRKSVFSPFLPFFRLLIQSLPEALKSPPPTVRNHAFLNLNLVTRDGRKRRR